jgi:hypothetical protein
MKKARLPFSPQNIILLLSLKWKKPPSPIFPSFPASLFPSSFPQKMREVSRKERKKERKEEGRNFYAVSNPNSNLSAVVRGGGGGGGSSGSSHSPCAKE